MERGQVLHRWFKTHPYTHCVTNVTVAALLLAADPMVLLGLPRLFLAPGRGNRWPLIMFSALSVGAIRGWVTYSLVQISLHEGAAHRIISPPRGPVGNVLQGVAANLCRLGGADPVDFPRNHPSHHAHFGTERDGAFLNFVLSRRYWLTLIPLPMFLNVSDFMAHRPSTNTRSRFVSAWPTLGDNGLYKYFMMVDWGPPFTLFTVAAVAPPSILLPGPTAAILGTQLNAVGKLPRCAQLWIGCLGIGDRRRPWGQPCHGVHHMIPGIPWYHQIVLHRPVVSLLTPRQRKQSLLQPFVGYPK